MGVEYGGVRVQGVHVHAFLLKNQAKGVGVEYGGVKGCVHMNSI